MGCWKEELLGRLECSALKNTQNNLVDDREPLQI